MIGTQPSSVDSGSAARCQSGVERMASWGVIGRALLMVLLVTTLASCGRTTREAVEPIAVSDSTSRANDLGQVDAPHSDATDPQDAAKGDADPQDGQVGGTLAAGGLWVVDAEGTTVGWLVQRGHPFQAQDGKSDILRDGVLVYSASEKIFFGVAMATGLVLVPRLGIADPQCNKPSVAGYYAAGDQISGMDYAFAYKKKWWRVRSGQPTELVQCAGVTKQGATPTCVLHSGTCRGFPVEPLPSPKLPTSFKAPLRFSFGVSP